MTETIRCPDCGQPNPVGSESCSRCNFPLAAVAATERTETARAAGSDPTPVDATPPPSGPEAPPVAEGGATAEGTPYILPPRRRPPRPRPMANQALSLWLMFAFIMAATVIYIAVKANVDRANEPVEGSNEQQQGQADEFRAALEKDSTNVEAHVGLANILYDTGNWTQAIVHYQAALRRDTTRTAVLVDLGVCYYNLSRPDEAEALFRRAIARDPHHSVALFNLGIVHERRGDYEEAFQFLHQALQSGPPDEMKPAIMEAMQRIQEAQGKKPPPLPDGR
jgi:cytochrome c-type biogenesis protein CcmH/NrfG